MANSINATSTGNGGLITTGDDSGVLNIQTNETTAISIDASQSVDFTNNIDAPNTFGFKNRLINGGMVIDQRNAGASVTPTSGQYTLDRWTVGLDQASKFSVQQSSTAPVGFVNSMLCTSLSSYSVLSTDSFQVRQNIEGLNVSDLAWGTANAATVTLSFWVRSSLTGTFGGSIVNSAYDRSYPFSYTISAANTWEQKSVTLAGDTSGTWLTTNGVGVRVCFGLGAGASKSTTAGAWASGFYNQPTGTVSVVGTSGATLYITGVQLEKGTQATSFDFRSYGTELALCQRYYYRLVSSVTNANILGVGLVDGSTTAQVQFSYPVTMRTSPTAVEQSGTATNYALRTGSAAITCSSVPAFVDAGQYTANVLFIVASGLTSGQAVLGRAAAAGAYLAWSAEL